MRLIVLALSASLALAGCGKSEPLTSTAELTVVPGAEGLPPPMDANGMPRAGVVGPLDVLQVDVFGVPDLSREVQVDGGGFIALPLAGTIAASGLSTAEIAAQIRAALQRQYVRDPKVSVNLKSAQSQVVAVDGQIKDPGLYPATTDTTLMRTVALANGLTDYAKLEEVVVLRTVNGQRMAGLYDLGAIRRGIYADPRLYANDVVIVGDSPERRLFRDIVSAAPLIAAPLVAILR